MSLIQILTLLLLFTPALGAPTAASGEAACADVRRSSLALNRVARNVSLEARNGSRDVTSVSSKVLWMEAKDKCDPGSLGRDSGPCVKKIFDVLKSYKSAVERVGQRQYCSQFANKVKPALDRLQADVKKCVVWKTDIDHQEESQISALTGEGEHEKWDDAPLCHYIMDRLFSFSILAARVFALGDPAKHDGGSADRCM